MEEIEFVEKDKLNDVRSVALVFHRDAADVTTVAVDQCKRVSTSAFSHWRDWAN